MPVDVVSYLYAATVAAGGIIGYVKAGNGPARISKNAICSWSSE